MEGVVWGSVPSCERMIRSIHQQARPGPSAHAWFGGDVRGPRAARQMCAVQWLGWGAASPPATDARRLERGSYCSASSPNGPAKGRPMRRGLPGGVRGSAVRTKQATNHESSVCCYFFTSYSLPAFIRSCVHPSVRPSVRPKKAHIRSFNQTLQPSRSLQLVPTLPKILLELLFFTAAASA